VHQTLHQSQQPTVESEGCFRLLTTSIHTFAILLQDANVDPLIRQQMMGHKPTLSGGLKMTV
jgi:hypothetical protein